MPNADANPCPKLMIHAAPTGGSVLTYIRRCFKVASESAGSVISAVRGNSERWVTVESERRKMSTTKTEKPSVIPTTEASTQIQSETHTSALPTQTAASVNVTAVEAPKEGKDMIPGRKQFNDFIERIKNSRNRSKHRSHSKLSFRSLSNLVRHKRRVNTLPEGFEKWEESDKRMYYETSYHFRLFKCEEWQCAPIQQRLSAWTVLWKTLRNPKRHMEHIAEMAQYRKTVKFLAENPITQIDLEF
ncbi:unnamed protein product [Bursaphelenchus xylophilus]|uniref:(pine wood nematode) hypothetical protein n=1 Tax=Bursaphelenchus xylophilus TaxID=6326 RepID=A0A1I7S536_BURXY|nr:unnamed protein product [Bursaphelenchus xylophilus]CAG9117660.1 unnamed protein product [Bursaphelenchus xylophilus]